MLAALLLIRAACARPKTSVGVCWSRNEITNSADAWAEVRASAVTLRACATARDSSRAPATRVEARLAR